VNPLLGFYAAITRQDADGYPEDGWYPEEALTREEALRGFTLDAAYAAFQEADLGSLEPGKWADFIVLSRNIMTIPPPEVLDTRVLATYLGGTAVYEAE
jgi:predicted amidohydrolase YtcJ